MTYTILGGFLIISIVQYTPPPNPILIMKAPYIGGLGLELPGLQTLTPAPKR